MYPGSVTLHILPQKWQAAGSVSEGDLRSKQRSADADNAGACSQLETVAPTQPLCTCSPLWPSIG